MEKQPPWSKNLLNPNRPIRILAIAPGTRYTAVAVFENNDLIYSTVKTVSVKGKFNPNEKERNAQELLQRASKIIAHLICAYQPDLVVQEKLFYIQCKTSDKLQKLVRQLKKVARKMQVDYQEYPSPFIRQQICQQKKATKEKTFKILAARHPELVIKLDVEKLGKDKYWDQKFDAVALGFYAYQKLKNQ